MNKLYCRHGGHNVRCVSPRNATFGNSCHASPACALCCVQNLREFPHFTSFRIAAARRLHSKSVCVVVAAQHQQQEPQHDRHRHHHHNVSASKRECRYRCAGKLCTLYKNTMKHGTDSGRLAHFPPNDGCRRSSFTVVHSSSRSSAQNPKIRYTFIIYNIRLQTVSHENDKMTWHATILKKRSTERLW